MAELEEKTNGDTTEVKPKQRKKNINKKNVEVLVPSSVPQLIRFSRRGDDEFLLEFGFKKKDGYYCVDTSKILDKDMVKDLLKGIIEAVKPIIEEENEDKSKIIKKS
ncbi:MAG: hypothetical protein AAGE79_01735 [Acinetobacter pittii]